MKNRRKSGEFNLVKTNVKYFTVRTKVLRKATKGNPNKDDYFKIFVCESENDRDKIYAMINEYFSNYPGIIKFIELFDLDLENYEKEYESKKSLNLKIVKSGKADKIKLKEEFIALNLEEFKQKEDIQHDNNNNNNNDNKIFIQTTISGFKEKEINNWRDSYLSKMFNEKGINKYKNDGSLDIARSDIEGDQSISTWKQIMKDFLIDIYENFPRNKSIESENYILHYFVFKYRTVTKKLSNKGENLPSKNIIHIVEDYCKKPVTYGCGTTNGNEDYYLYREQLKEKYGYDITEIFKEYNKTKSTKEFVLDCRKRLLFKD